MAEEIIRKRVIDGEEFDVVYRHCVPLKDINSIPGGWGYYSPMNQRTYEENGILCEQDVAITLSDGVTIYADIYRPVDGKNIPCIMAWSIYGKRPHDMPRPWATYGVPMDAISNGTKYEGPDPYYWCHYGYAVANVDPRGCGHSEGEMPIWGDTEGKDGAEVVEWLAKQEWCNGKIDRHQTVSGKQLAAGQQYHCQASGEYTGPEKFSKRRRFHRYSYRSGRHPAESDKRSRQDSQQDRSIQPELTVSHSWRIAGYFPVQVHSHIIAHQSLVQKRTVQHPVAVLRHSHNRIVFCFAIFIYCFKIIGMFVKMQRRISPVPDIGQHSQCRLVCKMVISRLTVINFDICSDNVFLPLHARDFLTVGLNRDHRQVAAENAVVMLCTYGFCLGSLMLGLPYMILRHCKNSYRNRQCRCRSQPVY